jgi:hypothetical protein
MSIMQVLDILEQIEFSSLYYTPRILTGPHFRVIQA